MFLILWLWKYTSWNRRGSNPLFWSPFCILFQIQPRKLYIFIYVWNKNSFNLKIFQKSSLVLPSHTNRGRKEESQKMLLSVLGVAATVATVSRRKDHLSHMWSNLMYLFHAFPLPSKSEQKIWGLKAKVILISLLWPRELVLQIKPICHIETLVIAAGQTSLRRPVVNTDCSFLFLDFVWTNMAIYNFFSCSSNSLEDGFQ